MENILFIILDKNPPKWQCNSELKCCLSAGEKKAPGALCNHSWHCTDYSPSITVKSSPSCCVCVQAPPSEFKRLSRFCCGAAGTSWVHVSPLSSPENAIFGSKRVGPVHIRPVHSGPVCIGPVRSRLVHIRPLRIGPVHSGPVWSRLVLIRPVRSGLVHIRPVHNSFPVALWDWSLLSQARTQLFQCNQLNAAKCHTETRSCSQSQLIKWAILQLFLRGRPIRGWIAVGVAE